MNYSKAKKLLFSALDAENLTQAKIDDFNYLYEITADISAPLFINGLSVTTIFHIIGDYQLARLDRYKELPINSK